MSGSAQVKRSGEQVDIDATSALRIVDYGIAQPTFAGITMADDVQIEVTSRAPIRS